MGAQGGDLRANEVEVELDFGQKATYRARLDFRALHELEYGKERLERPLGEVLEEVRQRFPEALAARRLPIVIGSEWVRIAWQMLLSGEPAAGYSEQEVGDAMIAMGGIHCVWPHLFSPVRAAFDHETDAPEAEQKPGKEEAPEE